MRVLYFSRDYTTHDFRFLEALERTKHEVFFLQLERRGHALEDRPLPPQVEKINWVGGDKPFRFRDAYRLVRGLRKVIQNLKPDIIHAGPIQTSAFLTALSGFTSLVSMSWGYDLLHDAQRSRLWQWATRYTLERSAAFVGDCDTIRRHAVEMGMRADRIVIFPWGVDLEHFKHRKTNTAGQPLTILSTRSWEPIYGVEVLAQAFAQAAQTQPELRLVMTGNGSLAGRLHEIFRKTGVQDQVILPGYIRQSELPTYYQSADLYVSASHSDGSSISLLEAMACGCPVLISDIPGNLEWVEDGVQGWIFPDGDNRALAQAIQQAYSSRSRLAGMGEAARQLTEQRADWQKNFPNLLKAYKMAAEG